MTDPVPGSTLVERCRDALRDFASASTPHAGAWLELDLTMGQFKAMLVLSTRGPMPIGGLARALGIGEPAASLLVDKLEERDLASREGDPEDRRRTLVVPSKSGRAQVDRLRLAREERVTGWLTHMSDDDLRALLRGLESLTQSIKREDQPAGATEGTAP